MKVKQQFLFVLVISFILHFISLVSWFLLIKEKPAPEMVSHISITINNKTSAPPVEDQSETVVDVKERVEDVLEKAIPETPEINEQAFLPDEYKAGDQQESANQVDQTVTEIDAGSNQPTEQQKKSNQTGGGVVTTDSQMSERSEKMISGEKSEDNFLENFKGAYNTLLGYDDDTNESKGELEDGLESAQENNTESDLFNESDDLGNYKLLTDQELESAFVKDPFSEKRGKELKLINIYFEQISKVIYSKWTNPLSPSEIKENPFVRIRLELNDQGYLEEPKLYIQSKFPKLDQSLLSAIRKSMSHRFSIPPSYLQKYKFLMLTWSSDNKEYELMPFEKEAKSKE